MQGPFGLILDGLYHQGMAVVPGANGDLCGKAGKEVAVRVADPQPVRGLSHQWIASGIGRRYELTIHFDEGRRPRTWQGRLDFGIPPWSAFFISKDRASCKSHIEVVKMVRK